MKLEELLVIIVIFAILYCLVQKIENTLRKLPPGPFRLPLVGNLIQIAKECPGHPHIAFTRLAEKYGDIVYYMVGFKPIVSINGYEAVKEVLKSDEWLDRIDDKWMLQRTFGKRIGIIFSDIQVWKATRRFTMRKLRDYGYGKSNVEAFIQREMEDLNRTLDSAITDLDGIIEPCDLFQIPTVNIVWTLVSGTRFSHMDPQAVKLAKYIEDFSHEISLGTGILNAYPFLMNLAPSLVGMPRFNEISFKFHKFFGDLIEEFRMKGTYKSEPENYIEVFLQQIDAVKDGRMENGLATEELNIFTDENLISVLYDLFWAGSETTSSWLSYAILWLTLFPQVQSKFRKELVEFETKNGRVANFSDRNGVPYTRAVILEIGRRSTIAPQGPRKLYQRTEFRGYTIPKGTSVIINYHSVLMDKKYWGDPEAFRPERFLDQNGTLTNYDHVIQFSLGKRNCLGEMIAETTSFHYLTEMVRKYEFLPLPGHHYDVTPQPGIVVSPKPYKILVQNVK